MLSPLAAYTVLWGISSPLEALKGCFIPCESWGVVVLLLATFATMFPDKLSIGTLAFSARILKWLTRIPFTWDSEVMCGLTDLAFVANVIAYDPVAGREASLVASLGGCIRRIMAWFYFFAGFWKLNTSFLDHRYSCASVYFAQLIDAYAPPGLLTPDLEILAITAAPLLTVALETAIGVFMLISAYSANGAPKARAAGIVLATALHIGIDITPKPNNIATFSHKAALRYFWFIPYGGAAAVSEARSHPIVAGALYAAVGASCLALTVAAQQPEVWAQWTAQPMESLQQLEVRSVDWHVAAHSALSALLLRGLWLGEQPAAHGPTTSDGAKREEKEEAAAAQPAPSTTPSTPPTPATPKRRASSPSRASQRSQPPAHLPPPPPPPPPSAEAAPPPQASHTSRTPALVHLSTAVALLWACGGVVSGALEINTPNMFSNLRMQGGTNHLLGVPTALLQQWRYDGPAVTADPFSGGIVRVESSTSTHINRHYPADETPVLTAGTTALLKRAGHSGRTFNSAVTRVVGWFALPPRPDGAPFVPFTLPALEVRRLLRDARASGEPFEVIYTSLPGASGDEQWRASAEGRRVKLTVDGHGGGESCTVLAPGAGGASACQADDLALAPFPARDFAARPFEAALGFLQSWNSLPILSTADGELHCYGS